MYYVYFIMYLDQDTPLKLPDAVIKFSHLQAYPQFPGFKEQKVRDCEAFVWLPGLPINQLANVWVRWWILLTAFLCCGMDVVFRSGQSCWVDTSNFFFFFFMPGHRYRETYMIFLFLLCNCFSFFFLWMPFSCAYLWGKWHMVLHVRDFRLF